MSDLLAIVSRAIFERDARVEPGAVWPVDRYTSANKALQPLAGGGRIFLVTVRPPNERLWLVGVLDQPVFRGDAWIAAAPNALPVTDITALRRTIAFESGKGMLQDKGTLGMSLQTPRALAASDVDQILAAVRGGAPVAAPARPAPRVLDGRYEIVRALGQGGMGVVYEARHTGTGRRVAVKEIIAEAAAKDRVLVERFQREARATAAIETQHIAPVLDTGRDPATGHPYLVMELLDGRDLQELIVEAAPLREPVALRIAAQACTGLARAHAAGVIHRDIKPANLFLARRDGDVVVKLLDFGVARVADTAQAIEHRLTQTGIMLGTPLYMSPEQVMGAKDLDHRTDLWSLGVVLYEALSGTTPHDTIDTLGGLMVAICSRPGRRLQDAAPHVRDSAARIVERALQLDIARRYQTADEMLADLVQLLPGGMALDDSVL